MRLSSETQWGDYAGVLVVVRGGPTTGLATHGMASTQGADGGGAMGIRLEIFWAVVGVWFRWSCRFVAWLANMGRVHNMLAHLLVFDDKSVYRTVIPVNKYLYFTTHSAVTSDLTAESTGCLLT
jgi:hypothetical protein